MVTEICMLFDMTLGLTKMVNLDINMSYSDLCMNLFSTQFTDCSPVLAP